MALGLVVSRVDLAAVVQVVGGMNPLFVVATVAASCLDLVCRTFRWQRLLAPIKRVRFRSTIGYLLIGYLANNLLPARLGELVRSHYLGDREGFSRATALGTVVVERVVDTSILVVTASLAIVVLQVRGVVVGAVLVSLGVTGLLVVGLAFALAGHRLPWAARLGRRIERWPGVIGIAARLRDGLAVAGHPSTLAWAIGWSCVAWAMSTAGFAAAGRAIGVQLTWPGAILLTAGIALSTAIPAGPGYVGTFELAGVQIAGVLGIAPTPALALTILAHGASILVTSAGGAVALARLGWGQVASTDAENQPPVHP